MKILNEIAKDKNGATAIEYGFISTLIGLAIITSLSNFQNSFSNTMIYARSNLNSSNN
jgi:Flp pilus assembly pilin Flp